VSGEVSETAGSSTVTAPVKVVLAPAGLQHESRATWMVTKRELIRMKGDRTRMLAMLAQPVLFLFVLGNGLAGLTAGGLGGVDFKTFMFPGILATSTLFTAMFAAISVVWDREYGFLREMMVAPVSRTSIILGKALGGSIVATLQGAIIILLGPLVGVGLTVPLVLQLMVEIFIISFAITSFGLVLASRVKQMQAVMGIMQMIMLPLTMLSGAMYPLTNLPTWLDVLVKINPLTYGVHAVRTSVFDSLPAAEQAALAPLNPRIERFGIVISATAGIGIVLLIGLVLLGVAALEFRRSE
jgi:ABC-2 type transport system permease protein